MANKIITCPRCRAKVSVDMRYEKFTCGNCRRVISISDVLSPVSPSSPHHNQSKGSPAPLPKSNIPAPKSSGSSATIVLLVVLAVLLMIGMRSRNTGNPVSEPVSPLPTTSAPAAPAPTTQPASSGAPFSQTCRSGQDVYADIVSIIPEYGISLSLEGSNSTHYHSVVCRAVTVSGATVWVYMSVNEYNDDFDSSADLQDMFGSFQELTYSPSRRITGTAYQAESACDGLSEQIGCDLVLNYDS